jgi:glucose/arabinose dehydrogenase
MALVGNTLYVANTDALVRFPYTTGDTVIRDTAVVVAPLPAGRINRHWTKSLIASPDGKRLYVGVGSNSNVAEKGMHAEEGRAAIWEIDPATGFHTIYASGLRNPVGMAWDDGGGLWVAVNERDEIGSDVPPDYMTRVVQRGFYGWPYSYYGGNIDPRVKDQRPELVQRAIVPDYALGPHTASLGLAYTSQSVLGPLLGAGMFIGQHGSWNRKPRSGYKVLFIRFRDNRPQGGPLEVLRDFVTDDGKAYGRPVGVAIARDGALLVADDVGNVVWRVTRAN